MELKRRLSLVVAIMSVALGSGHLVQSVLVKPVVVATDARTMQPVDIKLVAAGPVLPRPKPVVVPLENPSFAAAKTEDSTNLFSLPNEPVLKAEFRTTANSQPNLAATCAVELDLQVEPSAMIGISLSAPCHPNERVVLRHAGLAVTGKTSGTGALFASLPALMPNADVDVRFGDGQTVYANVLVPDVSGLRRYGVQWLGADAFQLNAFENGAGYGERGHVSDVDTQVALAGQKQLGGFLSVLGDDQVALPMLAEVYTYPADLDAPVRIVVEAAITKGTCAREILGETLAEVGGDVTITDLTLAMPDCSAVGDILVLKNLDPDLKIASSN